MAINLTETDLTEFSTIRENFLNKTVSESQCLSYIEWERSNGHINTQMDMQRNYVWKVEQEQEMWDTLLRGVRIPELHAIMSGRTWDFCDGKQRLTCIFKILHHKSPFMRKYAKPDMLFIFNYKQIKDKDGKTKPATEIYFKELPEEIQAAILSTTISIAKYSNLTREEQIVLFRKINNGTALSNFAKGMSSYYYMRVDYTYPLLDLPVLKTSAMLAQNEEDVEVALVRTLLLIHYNKPIALEQKDLEKYYSKFRDKAVIDDGLEKVKQVLTRCQSLDILTTSRSWISLLPMALYIVYKNPQLSSEEIQNLFSKFVEKYHGERGNTQNATVVERRLNTLEKLIA